MADRASLDIEMSFGKAGKSRKSGNVRKIVVLGDFGDSKSTQNMDDARRQSINIDNFDKVVSRIGPRITVSVADPVAIEGELTFRSLDDFHPDSLYEELPVFGELAGIRRAVSNSSTEENGLKRLSALLGKEMGADNQRSADSAEAPAESESDAVARLLGGPGRSAPKSKASRTVDQLIQSALGDANIEKKSVTAEVASQEVDTLLTEAMRSVLRFEDFQRLESCWRGVDWLVRRIEEDEAQIEIIDTSWSQLENSLNDAAGLENSVVAKLVCDVEEEDRPDLIVVLFTIERDVDHLSLLTRLGAIAARAGAVVATHGSLDLIGCAGADELDTPNNWSLPDDDTTEFWREVQEHTVAQHLSLLTPRFILRYPYGKNSDSIEAFKFEELPVKPDHEAFCWGNPALLFALGSLNGRGIIDDLPMPIFDNGLGQARQPPTEAYVSDRAAALASENGIGLLRVNRNSGAVAVMATANDVLNG